ncbi:MAG: glycosyltransferase family 4 protein [Candidatus Levybacteria bacterium]|nr:glycosyltransferase family 4 protein [Candidatus Levybacteria bacterium]
MTILFFSRLFWPHGGGVERHVLEVGKRLAKKGHKVTVVTESAGNSGNIFGIHIVRHDFGGGDWFKKFRIWKWLWQHRELIKNADIVHAHDVFFWYLPFRFLYLSKPVYTTFHGYETRFPPAKKAIFWRKLSEKLSWGNICVGDYIQKWYGTMPTYVTYGGVDVHLGGVHPATSEVLKIMLIGRFEKDIGVFQYLETLDFLKKQKIDFRFEAYGEGLLQRQIEKYGKVYRYPKNIEEKIAGADVVFASSYLSILSAMAARKPVIAVYTNPLKKDYLTMIPFSKFISIVDSADKIADEVENLGKTQTRVEQAYAWAKEQTWEKVMEMYLKLWRI